MRVRRKGRAQAEEAQCALAVAAEHARAGYQAQKQADWPPPETTWAPPGAPETALTVAAPPAPPTPPAPDTHAEFLRVLEVVTRMCDHVIEYLEADRAERRLLVETLGQVARALTATANTAPVMPMAPAAPAAPLPPSPPAPAPTVPPAERVIGGSMPAGPEPTIDLTAPEARARNAVEVRCRFGEGERWVDGFEVVSVEQSENGPRYRLRRQRDGAILPQLFEAASVRPTVVEEITTAVWSRL
jgi:hypothetical protein